MSTDKINAPSFSSCFSDVTSSDETDKMPSYDERKKFWEKMSTSQSSEMIVDVERNLMESATERISNEKMVKNIVRETKSPPKEKETVEKVENVENVQDIGLVKSLTDSYSKKIAAGELVMPAIPMPKSFPTKDVVEEEKEEEEKISFHESEKAHPSDTVTVLESEAKQKTESHSLPITKSTVISGSTKLVEEENVEIMKPIVESLSSDRIIIEPNESEKKLFKQEQSTDSEAEYLAKYGVESVAFDNTVFFDEDADDVNLPLSERKKVFEELSFPARKSLKDRSMSLPAQEISETVKAKKKLFEKEIKNEVIVERIISHREEIDESDAESKVVKSIETSELPTSDGLPKESTIENADEVVKKVKKVPAADVSVKDIHLEKNEIEGNEKEKLMTLQKTRRKDESSSTTQNAGKKQIETSSVGESEDTQSESDVTPDDARLIDNEDAQWDINGSHSGDASPKDHIYSPEGMGESVIGRWIGQEDLSKSSWGPDNYQCKTDSKWERTRSECVSPKEHHQYVYTPEEHFPDTVWEAPVQEQLEKEETVRDIPIEKQIIIEKDEEEEDEEEEEEVEVEEGDYYCKKLTQQEAKEIAEELLEYIQCEVENKSTFLTNDNYDDDDDSTLESVPTNITEQLRELANKKELDKNDVMEIEKILMKEKRGTHSKPLQVDTAASSVDITDEELRSTGADNDLSPIESQVHKLQSLDEEDDIVVSSPEKASVKLEKMTEEKEGDDFFEHAEIKMSTLRDEDIVDQTIAEVKESLGAAQEQLIAQHKKRKKNEFLKKESPSEFEFKGMSGEKISEYFPGVEEVNEPATLTPSDVNLKSKIGGLEDIKQGIVVIEESGFSEKVEDMDETIQYRAQITDFDDEKMSESFDGGDYGKKTIEKESDKDVDVKLIKDAGEDFKVKKDEKIDDVVHDDESVTRKDFAPTGEADITTETDYSQNLEIKIPETGSDKKMIHRSSEDSSSKCGSIEDSIKSPPTLEEVLSSTSSIEKQVDVKSGIVFRHSTSSARLKADRRSGADLEPYSSSSDSHYQSFEQTTSRPCSSDVEALVAGNVGTAGSSEYESAASHEVSSKQATSADYQTAVSSLSSRESIKSLDSESSGNLASIEVSSEASETLVQSALELDKEPETPEVLLFEDDASGMIVQNNKKKTKSSSERSSLVSSEKPVIGDEDFEMVKESQVLSWERKPFESLESGEIVAEEAISDEDCMQKMKRSYEMTFQPEPKLIAFSNSIEGLPKENFSENVPVGSMDETSSIISVPDERIVSSLEDSSSILSTSLSTISEPSAVRTVIELSQGDSEKLDGSLTVSGISMDHDDLDGQEIVAQQSATNEISTSTLVQGINKKVGSVIITTSSSEEQGVSYVSTQVTSVSRKSSTADETKTERKGSQPLQIEKINEKLSHLNGPTEVEYVPDYDDVDTSKTKKLQGHRRKESTSNFVPTMTWNLSEAKTQKPKSDFTDGDEISSGQNFSNDVKLTEKEVKNDEKKEADDSEKAEDSLEKFAEERKISVGEEVEEFRDYDNNRSLSQISRTDSRPVSSVFSEDQPDSELSELMKQGSSETEKEDIIERPSTPEPEEMENKDITPEFSSEAQASVTELEMEYSSAYSRRDEYASHVSPIREERLELNNMDVTNLTQDREYTLPPQSSLESTIEEKHELESGEKDILEKSVIVTTSSTEIPDIKVTEDVTQETLEKPKSLETKEKKIPKTPDTPSSTHSRTSSISTDQGKEYNLEGSEIKKFSKEILAEEKEMSETKEDKDSAGSPSSDSFEMLDKPDISDEYVIIEEVGREAEENDKEGKSIQISSKKKTYKKPKEKTKEDAKEEELKESPPGPTTKMTDLKYFPKEDDAELFSFDSESPPQPPTRKFVEKIKKRPGREEKTDSDFDQHLEQSKKWVEMQFQEQAAKVIGAYGYEMEYERAPLEDIKEEDLNDLESSSKIGSMGSQKESIGSFSSVKDSFSSTPDYDVLAGRKYFTRSGEHDDVSMSSLQEFELIERKIMENGKKSGSSSSQDSLNSKKLGTSSKSGQGDDISLASLREFENLENACATVVTMESKAKQEEQILSEIDEGHESQISESESCETVSAVIRDKLESECDDFDKKMFEIDEIIKQAQTNVEKFSELQAMEKIESMGRGDSYEEVAKVPDLELDMPFSGGKLPYDHVQNSKTSKLPYSTQVVTKKKIQQWREMEKIEESKRMMNAPKEVQNNRAAAAESSLSNGTKVKSISADSLEISERERQMIRDGNDDAISLDSYKTNPLKTDTRELSEFGHKSDSMEEVRHHKSSSGDYSSLSKDESEDLTYRPTSKGDFVTGSNESLDPSSSAGTQATYQYETDSVMSSSFTSADSNTMISSTDNIDFLLSAQKSDFVKNFTNSKPEEWLEDLSVEDVNPLQKQIRNEKTYINRKMQQQQQQMLDGQKPEEEYSNPDEEIVEIEEIDEYGNVHKKKIIRQKLVYKSRSPTSSKPDKMLPDAAATIIHSEKFSYLGDEGFVTETVEPLLKDDVYSHVVHRRTQMMPEVEKVTFTGPQASEAFKEFSESLRVGGQKVEEVEEIDEFGNVHRKRIIREQILESNQFPVGGGETTTATDESKGTITKIEKIKFSGPDSEQSLKTFTQSLKPEGEIIEREEVDEYGNVRRRKILQQTILMKPEELSEEQIKQFEEQKTVEYDVENLQPDVQRLIVKGADAETAFQRYVDSIPPEGQIETIEEEIDEHGNVRRRVILKEKIIVKSDELDEGMKTSMATGREKQEFVKMPSDIEKLTFTGSDAEEQLQAYMKNLTTEEVIETEEVDENGDVHVRKILKEKILIRPEELVGKVNLEGAGKSPVTEIQKIIFKGSDAEENLRKYKENLGEEIIEVREEDELGNVHVKKILRERRLMMTPGDEATESVFRETGNTLTFENIDVGGHDIEYRETIEPITDENYSHVIHKEARFGPEVQKITFTGPDADEAYKKFTEKFRDESAAEEQVEEFEETDESGNVHVKKRVTRKLLIDP